MMGRMPYGVMGIYVILITILFNGSSSRYIPDTFPKDEYRIIIRYFVFFLLFSPEVCPRFAHNSPRIRVLT